MTYPVTELLTRPNADIKPIILPQHTILSYIISLTCIKLADY